MSFDVVKRVRIVAGGSEVMSVDDVERVRFVVEDDLGSGETDDENAAPANGIIRYLFISL